MSEPNRKLPTLTTQDTERFWSKVDKAGPVPVGRPDLGPCWLWTAGTFRGGYGLFSAGKRLLKAHRVSYFLATGEDPGTRLACHSCDRPGCVNPAHVFLGTWADNMSDREAKGRTSRGPGHRHGAASGESHWTNQHPERILRGDDHWMRKKPHLVPRGERCGRARFTPPEIIAIRKEHRELGTPIRVMAKQRAVTPRSIRLIISRETWGHIPD